MADFYYQHKTNFQQTKIGIEKIVRSCCYLKGNSYATRYENYYVVRVSGKNGKTTAIGKTKKRSEAEELFVRYMPGWVGEIPYREYIQPSYKRKYKK